MNLGFPEMMFIFLMALILFGPKKLPEIGRQIGKFMAEFKRAGNEFKSQLETEMRQIEVEETFKKEKEALTQTVLAPPGTVASTSASLSAVESASPASPNQSPDAPQGPNA